MPETEPPLGAAEQAVLPPEGVPQIPSQYDSERGMYVAGANSGNVINFSPNITQTVGAGGEPAASEPRRIEVNDAPLAPEETAAALSETPAPAAPETAETGTESDRLRSLVEELREELRQEREARNQMMQTLMQSIDQQNQLMQRLLEKMEGDQPAPEEPEPTPEPEPAETPEPAAPENQEQPPAGAPESEERQDDAAAMDRLQEHIGLTGDGSQEESSADTAPATETETPQEQQYDWNPREGDYVSVMAANGAYENDWRIDKITGEGDDRRIRAVRGYATGGTPQEQIEESYQTFLSWQVGAGRVARRKAGEKPPAGNNTDETRRYPARDGVTQQPEEQGQEQQGQQEQQQTQEQTQEQEQDNSLRGRMRRIWDRTRYAAMWPFNRAYEYFYLAEDPAVRRRRGLGLLAAGMIVASAVTAYFAQKHGIHTGGGTGGILPGNGAPEHGPHGAEHIALIDPSEGHRRTGGVLPSGLDWGHDGSGHEIIVDNHGATVVGADQLPHGIMKANGALSDGAASALRKAGYNVGYVPMDNVTGQNGNLYAPVVS